MKFKKINILFMLIITVQIFSLWAGLANFSLFRTKFPVFSLSGKSKNQIPCFPCAVATLNLVLYKNRCLQKWFIDDAFHDEIVKPVCILLCDTIAHCTYVYVLLLHWIIDTS